MRFDVEIRNVATEVLETNASNALRFDVEIRNVATVKAASLAKSRCGLM